MKYALPIAMLVLVAVPLHIGWAQAPPDPNQPTVVELLVAPAPEPRPALKYSLLPTPAERTPGNAALSYYRAILLQKQLPKEYWQKFSEKSPRFMPVGPESKQDIADLLGPQRAVIAQVRRAALREHCDWELRLQDLRGLETISFLLPEIQECRNLAGALQLEARHALLDGRPGDALLTLRAGYQLARDTAQPPNLICDTSSSTPTPTITGPWPPCLSRSSICGPRSRPS